MKSKNQFLFLSSVVLVSSILAETSNAQSGIWTNATTPGTWSDTANWNAGTIADGIGSSADFSTLNPAVDLTVTLDTARTLGSLAFGDTDSTSTTPPATPAGWILTNGGVPANVLTLSGPAPGITVNTLTAGKSTTTNVILAGSGGFTKSGAGPLISTAANTYSGTTTANGGTFTLAGLSGSILNSGAIDLAFGATLALSNTAANGGPSADRVADTTDLNIRRGTFAFNHEGAAATNYSETLDQLTMLAGHGIINSSRAAIGQSSILTFGSLTRATAGTTLNFNGASVGNADLRNQVLFTTPPVLDGGNLVGGWALTGAADFATYGVNGVIPTTYTANTEPTWTASDNVKTNAILLTGDRVINSLILASTANTTYDLGTRALRIQSGGLLASGGTVTPVLANGTLTAGTSANTAAELIVMSSQANTRLLTVSAGIVDNGTGPLTLTTNGSVNNGGGVVLLSGVNTYTGPTHIAGGILRLGSATALTTGGLLTIANGGILELNGFSATAHALSGGGTLNYGAGNAVTVTLTIGANNTSGTFTGNVVQSSSRHIALVKNGSGTQILGGNVTNFWALAANGGFTINGGVLQIQNPGALGNTTSPVTINAGGTLQLDGLTLLNTGARNLNDGGTIRSNGTSALNRVTIGAAASAVTLSTVGAGDLFTIGNALNTVTGGQASTLIHVTGPGTIALNNDSNYAGAWSFNSGAVQLGAAAGLGPAATAKVTFGPASTASLRLNAQAVTLTALSTNATAGSPVIENGGTLTINGSTVETYAGVLRDGAGFGPLSLTKSGTGTLTLSGANTHTGDTTLSSGGLVINGSLTGSNLIANGGTLGGTGTVSGSVALNSGAIIAPGSAGVGTFKTGSLAIEFGSIANFEFGSGNDTIETSASGGLSIQGGTVNLYQAGGALPFTTPGTYNLIKYTGAIAGSINNLSIGNAEPGFTYAFNVAGGFVRVTIGTSGIVRDWIFNGGGSWGTAARWNGTVPNSSGATARFNTNLGSPATVTLDGNRTIGSLSFTSSPSGYTIAQGTSGSLIFNNGSNSAHLAVTAGGHAISAPLSLNSDLAVVVTAANDSLALSGIISGAGGFTRTGAGTLDITGASAAYAGPVSLSGGITRFTAGALGTGALTLNDTALTWLGANTEDISSRSVTFGELGATLSLETNVTLANPIGEFSSGGLTKTGAGSLTLAADTTFFGTTVISAGSLRLGNGGAGGSVSGPILNNAELFVDRSDTFTLLSAIGGTGALRKSGTNEVILGVDSTFTGETTIAPGGTLTIGSALALQGSALNYNIATSGTLGFGNVTAATLGSLAGDKSLSAVNAAAVNVALSVGGNNATTTYSGNLNGGGLTKNGTGILTLSGTSTFSGATNVFGGTLIVPQTGSITGGAISVGTNCLLQVEGGTLVSSGFSTITGGFGGFGIVINGNASVSYNGGVRTGNNDFAIIGVNGGIFSASDLTLQRTNSYGNGAAPNGPASLVNGLVVTAGTVNISNTLNIGTNISSAGAHFSGGQTTVGGVVTVGNNTANNRWNVLQVSGGSFTAADTANGIVLSPNPVSINRAQLRVSGGVAHAGRIGFGAVAPADPVPVVGIGQILVDGGSLYVGAGGIVQARPEFTSTILLSSGTLGADAAWSSSLPISLTAAFTISAADAVGAAHDIALSGAITGAGSLTKSGAGILTLAGVNTYSGATTVSAGILSVTQDDVLSDTAVVNVTTAGSLNLTHSGTDTVLDFQIDGISQGGGTYGALGSGAPKTTDRITGTGRIFVASTDPFVDYIALYPGLSGADAAKTGDPDKDGQNNLLEFALNGDPTSGAASGKTRSAVELVAGTQGLILTIPVRTGAVFSGTPSLSATLQKLTYTIQGTNNLGAFDQAVTEVIPAVTTGLLPLDTGWSYRSFRLVGVVPTRGPVGFLRAGVIEAP